METLICNKCFAGLQRGKQPYSLTECGHIYCQICAAQAERKCPQCEQVGVHSIPLQEPHHLTPQIARLFSSVSDALLDLHKSCTFQANQTKILTQRFTDMDSKYEILKTQYHKVCRYSKMITEKYRAEKARREELEHKFAWNMQSSEASLPSQESTPICRGNGMMNRTLGMQNSIITPSDMSSNISRSYLNSDGFRVPYHRAPKSADIIRRGPLNTPQYSFKNVRN